MENLTQFIEKLDKLTFSTVDRDKLELTSEEGFTVKLMLEISTIRMKTSYPIQVVVRVIKEGVIVASWGCSTNDDNQEAIFWLYQKGNKLKDVQYEEHDNKVRDLKAEFKSL
jgi:hypothetical protein